MSSWVGGRSSGFGLSSTSVRAARWRAAAPRYLVFAAVALFVGLGVRSAIWPPRAPAPAPPPAVADAPSQAFALQFARAYLSYDARHPERRLRRLAPFLPEWLPEDAGFAPRRGRQRVLWAEVASDQPALVGGRVITVAAQVSTQELPVYLAVTVQHRSGGALELAGFPALVGAPAVSVEGAPEPRERVEDARVATVVARVVRNYLSASARNLKADLLGAAVVSLPTSTLRVDSVDRIEWVGGPGSGAVVAMVWARDQRGASYRLAYELGIAYRERPYVSFIEVVPTAG